MGARWAMESVCVWKSWNIEHQVHSHTDTHDVSSPSAPPAASDATAPPEDNDQARKTAEHGEQRGDGVDAVNPGDPTRSGGVANRLNTRRNSQSKCGARRNACGQQPKQARATAQSIGAAGLGVLQTAVQLGAGGRRTAPPLHTATEAVGREGLPPQAPAHNTLARSPPKAALGPQQPHAAGAAAEADAGAHDDRPVGWPTADQPRHALRLGLRPHAGRPDRDRGLWRRTERLSVLARAHGSRAQLGRQAREPASRGSGGPGRGAEGVGGGRRRTCAHWARRSWPGKRPAEQLFRHTRFLSAPRGVAVHPPAWLLPHDGGRGPGGASPSSLAPGAPATTRRAQNPARSGAEDRSSSGGTVRQPLIYGTSPRCASWTATRGVPCAPRSTPETLVPPCRPPAR